ncbi:MAG: caspase family protein [Bacteroidota bacterium]
MSKITLLSLFLISTVSFAQKGKKYLPKVTEDAKITLDLISNVPNTKFIVDGKEMVTGERAKVLINKGEHTVEAIPKGYKGKKDYIQPPYYDKYTSLRFTFFVQDKVNFQSKSQNSNTASSSGNEAKPAMPEISSEVDINIPTSTETHPYRFALIVGNEDYSSFQTDLSDEIDVDFAKRDASVFKEYANKTLGIPETNITLLTNATAGQMRQSLAKLNTLASKTQGKAELYFYYAGHGLPNEQTKEPYLIPVDVSGTNVQYGIKLTDVYAKLTEHPTEKVTVFLDACFSGGARNQGLVAARGVRVKPKENSLDGKLIVFSASSGDQSSLPYKQKGHGMFTYHLLKKLQDSRGNLTYSQLSDYLKEKVSLESVLINSKEQDPQTNVSPSASEEWKNWTVQ